MVSRSQSTQQASFLFLVRKLQLILFILFWEIKTFAITSLATQLYVNQAKLITGVTPKNQGGLSQGYIFACNY